MWSRMMEHVMTTRTNTRFDEQLAQILTDLDVDLEREQGTAGSGRHR